MKRNCEKHKLRKLFFGLLFFALFLQSCTLTNLFFKNEIKDWRLLNLSDVLTNKSFRIGNRTTLIQVFSLDCKLCKEQQNELREFQNLAGDSVIIVSLSIDKANNTALEEYILKNNYDWPYSRPSEKFKLLYEKEFGAMNLSKTPLFITCRNQTKILENKTFVLDELIKEVRENCGFS